ncbi:MAG TPA: hypothetical protein VE987_05370 [Polyangiaceae bacterium]|nr:hypothetical protein [Polyangiaceae bacterium]
MTTNRSPGTASKRFVLALVAGATALTVAGNVNADGGDDRGCRFFDGPFSSAMVGPPTCTSPVGVCTHGLLQGDFQAIYDFTMETLQSANDPNDPTEFVYTGHSTVTTPRGVMHTNDSGMLHIPPGGAPAPFVTTASVVSGTGRFTGATGVFVATGKLDFATGDSSGSYIAQICRAHDDGQ